NTFKMNSHICANRVVNLPNIIRS
ncbi:type VI secretion, VC_A0110 family domain protein, partial [Vibrio parahaemolyticus V-223/04]